MTTLIAQCPVDVIVSRECPECGSPDTEWHCAQTTNSGVVDGRLRMHDVSTIFYLGCNCCSETICTVSGNDVAQWMNAAANACRTCRLFYLKEVPSRIGAADSTSPYCGHPHAAGEMGHATRDGAVCDRWELKP